MRILVTGASGYLGEAVVSALGASHDVVPLASRLEQIEPGSLEFDAVVHTAGALRHRTHQHLIANAEGTQHLINGLAWPTPVLLVSSRGVYSPSSSSLTEDSPVGVADSYGSTKLEAERILTRSFHPFIILRSTAIYGWSVRQPGMTFPTQAVRALLKSETVAAYQPDRPHDYLFVRDLATWILRLIEPGPHWNQIYNAAGLPGSVTELVSLIAAEFVDQTGFPAHLVFRQGPPAVAPIMEAFKLHEQIPGLGHTPVREVVRELILFMRTTELHKLESPSTL